MKKTNYNQSSTGTNFELFCFADSDDSRFEFEAAFEILEHESYRKTTLAFYTGPECRKAPASLADCYDLANVTEKQARAFCIADRPSHWTIRNTIEDKRNNALTWRDYLPDQINERSIYEAARDGFPTIPGAVLLFDVLSVQGYSQGDYALVLYAASDKFNGMQKYFCNLFYDCPIYCRLEIDGNEIDLMETAPDVYEYDPENIIERFEAEANPKTPEEAHTTALAIEFLRENLPKSLPYN